jgi:hypothetical protein
LDINGNAKPWDQYTPEPEDTATVPVQLTLRELYAIDVNLPQRGAVWDGVAVFDSVRTKFNAAILALKQQQKTLQELRRQHQEEKRQEPYRGSI